MGNLRIPTVILEKRGSAIAKQRRNEVKPKLTTKKPPAWLSEKGKKHWPAICGTLVGMNLYTDADQTACAMLCDALADYLELRDMTDKRGIVCVSEKGAEYQAPWVGAKNKAFDKALVLLKQFGLTPVSRAGVEQSATPNEDDPLRDFIN